MPEPKADVLETGNSADEQKPLASVSDLISEINEGGFDPNKPVDQPKTDNTPPAAVGATNTTPASSTKPAVTDEGQPSLEDPEFARRGDQPKTDEPVKSDQKILDTPAGEQKPDITPLYSHLSEMTEGTIKTEDDFRKVITHYNELVTQAEEGFKPKFNNADHKRAFESLANVPAGKELETSRRIHHALSLEPDKLKGKDLLFEAFLLDPDNADLSRDRAGKLFDLDYDQKYANASENELVARTLEKEERKAKDSIVKTQSEFNKPIEAVEQKPAFNPKVVEDVKKAVKDFAGIVLSFTENAPDNEQLKVKVEDQAETEELEHYMLNPQDLFSDLVAEHRDANGNFDYSGWAKTVWEIRNLDKVRRLSHNHGIELGKLQTFNKDRNSTPRAEKVLDQARVPAGGKKEAGSFHEAFGEAIAKKGSRK